MVVDTEAERADRMFQALADVTRRQIMAMVLVQEQSVSELARRFPMSFAGVQKHVALLERAGLVTKHRHGREQRVHGSNEALREVHQLLDQLEIVWRDRLDRIGQLLDVPADQTRTQGGSR
jgi:DNA-binding transcriptional ArsR family regulator